ncbi:MAG: hypothetical protein MZV70_11575, partial [Desulfobacterales bacterium]|nr:hypothetical protein [Desulfobacterales bacterium]
VATLICIAKLRLVTGTQDSQHLAPTPLRSSSRPSARRKFKIIQIEPAVNAAQYTRDNKSSLVLTIPKG